MGAGGAGETAWSWMGVGRGPLKAVPPCGSHGGAGFHTRARGLGPWKARFFQTGLCRERKTKSCPASL